MEKFPLHEYAEDEDPAERQFSTKLLSFLDNNDVSMPFSSGILTKDEQLTLVQNSTLGQLWKIHNYIDMGYLVTHRFFLGKDYETKGRSINVYDNRIMQYNLQKFFQEKKYKIVEEFTTTENNVIAPIKEDLQISINNTFTVYKDTYLLMQHETDKENKLVIRIDYRSYDKSFWYEVSQTIKKDILDEWLNFSKKNNIYFGKKINAVCDFLRLNEEMTWDDVILPDKIKKTIRNSIEGLYKIREVLKANNINMKHGIILSGAPGVGKTCVCKVLAKEVNMSVIYILPDHINSVHDITRICDMARDLSPTLLIFEDIDYIAQDRDDDAGTEPLVVNLMNQLDGLEEISDIITIATTNKLEKVEVAIKNRPGRFDKVIKIDKPDADCREKMLRLFTSKLRLDSDVNFQEMVQKTKDMTGAHLNYLVISAAVEAAFNNSYDENKKLTIKKSHFDIVFEDINDESLSSFPQQKKKKLGFSITEE